MTPATLWADILFFVDEFIRWSTLVINGTLIVSGGRSAFDRWRNVPTDELIERFITTAKNSFVILAIVGFAVLFITSPKPPPQKPIPCAGLTVARVSPTEGLKGDITPGKWQYDPNTDEITGPNNKKYKGHIDPADWCLAFPWWH
ncbi:MAG TPA: hypothetical protein VG387_21000 [Rhizomicrobium sp.]|jgi:hypothetical protein|nr:hypothetical protein [Rhizomicrobium sp.]